MDKKKILIISIGVIALTGIGIGIYFWNKKRTQSSSDSSGGAEKSGSSGGAEKSGSSGGNDETFIKNNLLPYGQETIDFGNSVLQKMSDSEKKIWANRIRSDKRSPEFEKLSSKYGIN